MKTAIIYHRVDWDGYTAAAVAKMAFPDAELIGWNYKDDEPCVSEFDRVIVVDLSLSKEWMLANASKLVWIDHHKNVIETLQNDPILAAVPGIRMDGIGACALAWEYFFHEESMPVHIRFAATADVMDTSKRYASLWSALSYSLYLDEFGPGCSADTGDVSKDLVSQAIGLFDNDKAKAGFVRGQELEADRSKHEEFLFKFKQETVLRQDELPYFVAVLHIDRRPNACILSHLLHHSHGAFICIGEFLKDKGKYKISLRVPSDSNFDASAFCRQYGGNGHIKAAGCLMSEEEIYALFN